MAELCFHQKIYKKSLFSNSLKVFVVKPKWQIVLFFIYLVVILILLFLSVFFLKKKFFKGKLPCRTLCCANDCKVGSLGVATSFLWLTYLNILKGGINYQITKSTALEPGQIFIQTVL